MHSLYSLSADVWTDPISLYQRFRLCFPSSAITSACFCNPPSRICSIQALRFDRNTIAKSFEMMLLNFPQSLTSLKSVQSPQLEYELPIQHERILHHVALVFFPHPGQCAFRNARHAPQYSPQYATNPGCDVTCFMSDTP